MGQYNRNFDLDINDLDRIECALRRAKNDLSQQRLTLLAEAGGNDPAELARIQSELEETRDLLGRLHNQKVFFRPAKGDAPYIGG
ncbi:MAG: hypothetical protein ACWA5A_01195 [Marinibacterium sp.]